MADRNISDIARETLRQLALRRLPPTPENYQAIYAEIEGGPVHVPFPEAPLRAILRVLPGQTPAQIRLRWRVARALASPRFERHVNMGSL